MQQVVNVNDIVCNFGGVVRKHPHIQRSNDRCQVVAQHNTPIAEGMRNGLGIPFIDIESGQARLRRHLLRIREWIEMNVFTI